MVSKRRFNKIRKEKPDSRIGKRTWEEQDVRNKLAKTLIKARRRRGEVLIDDFIEEKVGLEKDLLRREKLRLRKIKEKSEGKSIDLKSKYFEKISFESGIDENKLLELQQANLVLVYRDNNLYGDMSSALKDLVEILYGGKVYCVSIPKGTENLSHKDLELLKKILMTCNCMTDYTVSKWTGIESEHIPERQSSDIQEFLGILKNLEQKFIQKGINKVYIYRSYTYKDRDKKVNVWYSMFDHGCICQRENGSMYFFDKEFSRLIDEDKKKILGDAKRFWENMFPNLDVEFIDQDKVNGENCSQYNVEGSVLIADRHAYDKVEDFSGQKILYAGANFEPQGGIENFVNENDCKYVGSVGEAIAETVMLDAIGNGDKLQK